MLERQATYPIESLLLNRWSPRAMSGQPLEHHEFMRLIEAARWAPSSYNSQPWRFIYARRDTPAWEKLFGLLVPQNQVWAARGAVLVVILSQKNFEYDGRPSRTHSLAAGSAWQNLALQGWAQGLAVRGIEGFDYERARLELNIPDDMDVELMCVVGKPGRVEALPVELQAMEVPSDRKPVEELVFEGLWGNKQGRD